MSNGDQRARKSLADARLVDIGVEEFPDRIRELKQLAIGHLVDLLQKDESLREPRTVAHSLGTLSRLEASLQVDAGKTEQADRPATMKSPSKSNLNQ